MRWFRKKEEPKMKFVDHEQEAVHQIIEASKIIKAHRLAAVYYTILADRRDMSEDDLEAMANRLNAHAWEKKRMKSRAQ